MIDDAITPCGVPVCYSVLDIGMVNKKGIGWK